jgi:hypothetical protein
MGVTLSVDGKNPQVTQYTVSSDIVSLNPSDTSAGVGGISASTPLHTSGLGEDWKFMFGSIATIRDGAAAFSGMVTDAQLDDYDNLTVSAEGPLRVLNTEGLIPPFQGTISQCINHIMSAVTSGVSVVFDSNVSSDSTVYRLPAFYGAVWPYLRDFLVVHRLLVLNDPTGAVRVSRASSRASIPYNVPGAPQVTRLNESFVSGSTAEQVEVEWYGNQWVTNGIVVPVRDEDQSVISIGIGEIAIIEIPTKTGMSSVNQPTPVNLVDLNANYAGTNGRYSVFGDDALPVSAAAWTASGGSVKVDVKPNDPYTLLVTVTGPNTDALATTTGGRTLGPFHLASSDNSNQYSTLRITGTGVQTYPQTVTLDTGADDPMAIKGVGTTLQNVHVGSLSQAYDVGIRLAQAYSGAGMKVDVEIPFNHSDSFAQLQGGFFSKGDAVYRMESVSYSAGSASLSGVQHTTFGDFDARWAGKTFGDFDASWVAQSKRRFRDQGAAPLR